MSARARGVTDPFVGSIVVAVGLALTGLLAMGLAWAQTTNDDPVARHVPVVISGGFAGLALIGFSCGVVAIQRRRWVAAHRRATINEAIAATAHLLAVVREDPQL